MESTTTYPASVQTLGHLKQADVMAITMPRSIFLRLVGEALDQYRDNPAHWGSDLPAQLEAIVMPTARTMERFPLGTWISQERGCGCIVGEALVAAQQLEELQAPISGTEARQIMVDRYEVVSVSTLLEEAFGVDMRDILYSFGIEIDSVVTRHMQDVFGPEWDGMERVYDQDDGRLVAHLSTVVVFDEVAA